MSVYVSVGHGILTLAYGKDDGKQTHSENTSLSNRQGAARPSRGWLTSRGGWWGWCSASG